MNWNAYYPDERGFAGIDNFVGVFTDYNVRRAVIVTILLTQLVVASACSWAWGSRCCSTASSVGRGIVRTMMITPFLVVPVAAALLWKHALYNPEYGLLNGALTAVFGDNAPQPDWITNNPLISIVAALVWQWTPFMMLILLAGLQSRPLDVIEAARIDGASSWQIFRYMTLPHLRQYLELGALLGTIYVVQNFDPSSPSPRAAWARPTCPTTSTRPSTPPRTTDEPPPPASWWWSARSSSPPSPCAPP